MRAIDFISEINWPDELSISDQLKEYFYKRGYQLAGEGRDQIAFESPRGTVIKVLGIGDSEREKIVRDYVDFFVKNQNDPYIPKIYNTGEFSLGDETYFLYEMEYLHYVANEEETLDYLEGLMTAAAHGQQAVQDFQKNQQMPAELSEEEIKGLLISTYKLEKDIGGMAPLDLSMIENIRRRSDGHLVIMDPYSL